MPNILPQKEFAARVGVTPGCINRMIQKGKSLAAAVVVAPQGKRARIKQIDADHPAALRYVEKRAIARAASGQTIRPPVKPAARPTAAPAPYVREAAARPALPEFDPNEDIREYMNWSLAQIVGQFGTAERFRDWLTATKILVEIHAKNLQTLDKEGSTISRDIVRQHIFGSINDSNQRLLIDAPKTIARRISALAISGGTHEEAEKIIREIISKQLRNAQQTALKILQKQSDSNGGGNL